MMNISALLYSLCVVLVNPTVCGLNVPTKIPVVSDLVGTSFGPHEKKHLTKDVYLKMYKCKRVCVRVWFSGRVRVSLYSMKIMSMKPNVCVCVVVCHWLNVSSHYSSEMAVNEMIRTFSLIIFSLSSHHVLPHTSFLFMSGEGGHVD